MLFLGKLLQTMLEQKGYELSVKIGKSNVDVLFMRRKKPRMENNRVSFQVHVRWKRKLIWEPKLEYILVQQKDAKYNEAINVTCKLFLKQKKILQEGKHPSSLF